MLKKFFFPVLFPLSLVWEFIYRVRRFFYNYGFFQQNKFAVPIISVGNLTFGGTGKTPFTLWLSNYANEREKKVMVLMRGYRGKNENGHGIIHAGQSFAFNPIEFGDEAILLARRLKNASVVVGKRRSQNLHHYFKDVLPDLVVLDDGHQHLAVDRKLNIVLFDALLPVESLKVAPLGYLREGMSALRDADAIVIGRADLASNIQIEKIEEYLSRWQRPGVEISHMGYKPMALRNQHSEMVKTVDEMKGLKVMALAGIASPKSFFETLDDLEFDVIEKSVFPDHHNFTYDEILPYLNKAEENDAYLICTEKDMVKLRRISSSPRLVYLEINVYFLKGEESLKNVLKETVS